MVLARLGEINEDQVQSFLFLSLVFLVFLSNYSYGVSDQNDHIPIIKRMMDPTYLKNDWATNENDRFSARYYYSFAISYLSNFADLPTVFFSLYSVSLLLIMASIYYISSFIFKNNLASLLVVSLVLFAPNTSLGGTWFVSSFLTPSTVAMAFILLGIYFFLKKRLYVSFLLFGIASIFQVLIGLLVAVIMLSAHILVSINRLNFREISFSIACYLSLAFWSILPMALLSSSPDVSSLDAMNTIGFVRHPWHYDPFQFNALSYPLFASVMCLFIISMRNSPKNKIDKTVISIISVIAIMCIAGTLFVDIVPVPFIHNLQLFRTTPFAVMFAYIYIANFFTIKVASKTKNINKALMPTILVLMLISAATYGIYYRSIETKDPQRLEAYEWIKTNTPKEAIFITPPQIEDFRLGAERATVVDIKGFTFNSVGEWRKRIADVTNNIEFKFRGNRIEEIKTGFESLNESDYIKLGRKYQAQYIFLEKPKKMNLMLIYENEKFAVYRSDFNG